MTLRIESGGEPIPGYKLIERLGGGGFGEVWKCEAPGGLFKAIKLVYGDLQAEDEEGARQAEQELKALKRVKMVRHPYLLSLERYDIIENKLLIVMELADKNLWDRFRECRAQGLIGIPREELLRYMEEAAEVLDLMNSEHQLQHLDIKPQNLFLVHNHVKVADFGLVKDLEGMTGTVTGGVTPVYAPPETFDGVVSRFCDQYSLAMVYQELITGQRPFTGTSVQQLIMQHLTAKPNLAPLDPADRDIIGRGLAKKPEDRHPTISEMVRGLRAAGNPVARAPVHAAPATPAPSETEAEAAGVAATPRGTPTPGRPATGRPPGWVSPISNEPPRPAAERKPTEFRPREPEAGGSHTGAMNRPRVTKPLGEEPAPVVVQQPREEPIRQAPPEITGDGFLFPAVIVGLGGLGLEVLKRLRQALSDRFGSLQNLPHLRFLYVDTDPDTAQEATQVEHVAWNPADIVLARLQRPSHYMKPRDGRGPITAWMDMKFLYRMPRNPVTTGMRVLGRLGLIDNYRAIVGRLRAQLEAVVEPEVLTQADRSTRLGIRTNRPRVYLATGLAGGTGSGMFLDLAYVARNQLKQLGYAQPEVVSVLMLPPVERNVRDQVKAMGIGNTFAALAELNHFSAPEVTYVTRLDERDPAINDPAPPFTRSVLLPLPEERRTQPGGHIPSLAGDYLFRDLTTALGRTADKKRNVLSVPHQPVCQTFGLFRFSWPRRALLQRSARHLCRLLVERWVARETDQLKTAVQGWVTEQWAKQELGTEHLIAHLQGSCTKVLGGTPEDVFMGIVGPFLPKGRRQPDVPPPAVREAMERLEQIMGRPDEPPGAPRKPLPLAEALDKGMESLVKESTKKIAQLAVCLIEQPDYRIAGAEEAIRQITAALTQSLEHHEPLCKELGEQATDAHGRIGILLSQIQANYNTRRATPFITELVEVLRLYPKKRYQSLLLRRIINTCITLRGMLSDQIREVGFCRHRLTELLATFEDPAGSTRTRDLIPGHQLLPANCQSLDDALEKLLEDVTPEDLHRLDQQVQAMVQQQFTGVLHMCMSKSNLLKNLETAMQQQAEAFMGERVGGGNVVEMFLATFPPPMDAMQTISEGFERAAPELTTSSRFHEPEVDILAVPTGPLGQQLNELAQKALPEARLALADSSDDIVLYREQPHLSLGGLEQVGSTAEQAYRNMVASENFTPHSRTDVNDWTALELD